MEDEEHVASDQRRRQEIDEIGRAVKVARNGLGWSLRRLAEEAGVSASLLSAVETGKIVPTVGSLFAISDALGQSAETFFPARRRPTSSEPDDVGAERQESEPEAVQPAKAAQDRTDQERVSSQSSSAPISPAPLPHRAAPDREAVAANRARRGASRPVDRSIVRPVRTISRRASTTSRTKGTPTSPTPTGIPDTGPARDVAGPAVAALSVRGVPDDATMGVTVPGATLRRASQRPTVVLEDGVSWTLPVDLPDPIGKVIAVSIPAGVRAPSRHRVRDQATTLLVTGGRLRIDVAFVETILETGDSVVVTAGVPHRLSGHPRQPTTYLVFVAGAWDGTI